MKLIARGYLHAGQYQDTSVTLAAGCAYPVLVQPDDRSVDFDLQVFDENHNIVDFDDSAAPAAQALVTPAWTGPFFIRVVAARGSSGYSLYL